MGRFENKFPALCFLSTENIDRTLFFFWLRMGEISRLHTTNGKWDLAAEIQTSTLEEFDKAVSVLRKIDGIKATEINLLLSKRK